MTRYSDSESPTDSWYQAGKTFGYREGIDRLLHVFRDWDDEGDLLRDIQEAIEEGII